MMLEKIISLEHEIEQIPQAHCPVRHYLAGGLYAREMTIPAGIVLTGAVHKHEHLCTISQGRIIVSTDDGMKEMSAPCTLVSKPGAKRVGYALETTVWTTYHWIGKETDLDKITEDILESTREELMGGEKNIQLLNNEANLDRIDYRKFLDEYGLSTEQVKMLVNNEADRIDVSDETIEFRQSKIHGIGTFAKKHFANTEFVTAIRIRDKRAPAGWLMNHSRKANVIFVQSANGGLDAFAIKEIKKGDEITIDYRNAMSVNGAGFAPIEGVTQ